MSVDFGLMARLIVDAFDKKEQFLASKNADYVDPLGIVDFSEVRDLENRLKTRTTLHIISILVSLGFGVLAFYLSWTCNTAMGYHAALRVVFGGTAFFFGFTYVLLYILLRYDTCYAIMKH